MENTRGQEPCVLILIQPVLKHLLFIFAANLIIKLGVGRHFECCRLGLLREQNVSIVSISGLY